MKRGHVILLLALVSAYAGCGADRPGVSGEPPIAATDPPSVVVLGTAQDGGFPHAACRCDRCRMALGDPGRVRHVASLAIALPKSERVFLVDATPDIRPQLQRIRELAAGPRHGIDRAPVDGVLLTHAHLGHYTGLAFFGFEAVHTRDLPVHCSPSMAGFLRSNQPWRQLIEIGNVRLHETVSGEPIDLGDGVRVVPLGVPHRDELSDTLAFIVRGPSSSLLYVPDTEGWEAWETPIEIVAAGVDIALLDGSFFSLDELPGRDLSAIGHPLIRDSMDRLALLVENGSLRVYFTHLNHSNPALDPEGPQRAEIERRGFAVLEDGQVLPL